MKNNRIYYSVGALLYCPASNQGLATSIIEERFGGKFSLAICLEDSINDNFVEEAEAQLLDTLKKIRGALEDKKFYVPKIFIRVRSSNQMSKLYARMQDEKDIVAGFIVPKFSLDNADGYIESISKINETGGKRLFMMPIYESRELVDLRTRAETLCKLKDKLDKIEEFVLNIRVGGNDLCHNFGFRRRSDESIHKIRPIADIFSDIVTVYGLDYVISGPVWEYYAGDGWKSGPIQEIHDDQSCGFIGKTVIHPNQIAVVNDSYRVSEADYEDAKAIVGWNRKDGNYVLGSNTNERMNELKTHTNWANKVLYLAEEYGVAD